MTEQLSNFLSFWEGKKFKKIIEHNVPQPYADFTGIAECLELAIKPVACKICDKGAVIGWAVNEVET